VRCPKSVPAGTDLWGEMKGNKLTAMFTGSRKTLTWPQVIKRNIIWAGLLIVVIMAGVFAMNKDTTAMLLVDGTPLAVVTGEEQVMAALEKVKTDLLQEHKIAVADFGNNLTYDEKLPEADAKPLSDQELCSLLKERLSWQTDCWDIIIGGTPMLRLASEGDAQIALEEIKKYYLPQGIDQSQIEELRIAEDVTIAAGKGRLGEIIPPEAAVEAMVRGLDKIVQHTVEKGDSFWTIARDNNMTVSELMAANPDLDEDEYLQPGQKINLVKSEPLLNVVTTLTTTVEEKVPYSTSYENDPSLWRGQQKIIKPGTSGLREVTYRITRTNSEEIRKETLAEKILIEPVGQIVARGSKVMVASRGDGGSGRLAWPLRGRINSAYGVRRGRSVHTGLDIDGEKGDPVYSAETGVVLATGYKGNYGNCIDIDHGNGLMTRYAHLNSVRVKIGQQVARGDLIGTVGSTGKSTGPHLHFEVRINNVHQNPLKYLSQND
jgi:murein DD-endopeptidase MepM/ murein hydrolase activator NlpD